MPQKPGSPRITLDHPGSPPRTPMDHPPWSTPDPPRITRFTEWGRCPKSLDHPGSPWITLDHPLGPPWITPPGAPRILHGSPRNLLEISPRALLFGYLGTFLHAPRINDPTPRVPVYFFTRSDNNICKVFLQAPSFIYVIVAQLQKFPSCEGWQAKITGHFGCRLKGKEVGAVHTSGAQTGSWSVHVVLA